MAKIATDIQVQRFVNERVRVHSEQIRNLYLALKQDQSLMADIFAALTQPNPTWTDTRTDGPAHLVDPTDVLAWNTFIVGLIALVESGDPNAMTAAGAQYPIVQKVCIN